MRSEGLLEEGLERYVHTAALDRSFLDSSAFQDIFGRWLREVRDRGRPSNQILEAGAGGAPQPTGNTSTPTSTECSLPPSRMPLIGLTSS